MFYIAAIFLKKVLPNLQLDVLTHELLNTVQLLTAKGKNNCEKGLLTENEKFVPWFFFTKM